MPPQRNALYSLSSPSPALPLLTFLLSTPSIMFVWSQELPQPEASRLTKEGLTPRRGGLHCPRNKCKPSGHSGNVCQMDELEQTLGLVLRCFSPGSLSCLHLSCWVPPCCVPSFLCPNASCALPKTFALFLLAACSFLCFPVLLDSKLL